jgi:hypothetical protein
MICTKCFIDKPVEEYETYFHSTQNKQRTRRYCKSCFKEQKRKYKETIKMKEIIQPVVLELEIEVVNPFSTNPDYKQCRTCQEYKHKIDDYYYHGSSKKTTYLDCTKCLNLRELNRRRAERQEELESSGGSEKVHTQVGVWSDKYQKEQTYMVMKALGYTYSDECGHFLKPGVKEYVDGELKFYKVNKQKFPNGQKIDYNTPEWKEMFDLYMLGNCSQKQLSMKYGVSTATINKYINRTKNGETC